MRRLRVPFVLAAAFLVAVPKAGYAQERPELRVRGAGGETVVTPATGRGYAAVPVSRLGLLGWRVERTAMGAMVSGPGAERVELRDGTPFVTWDDGLLQMADPPYFEAGELHVPLQFLTDFLPWKAGEAYRFAPADMLLIWEAGGTPTPPVEPADPAPTTEPAPTAVAPAPSPGPRFVIIDAGHGGEDPGTVSRSGIREKNVALGIALAMADALRSDPGLEVVLIRDTDVFVPAWDRGARATVLKGDRHGVFVSIHANSAATRSSTAKGYETYFLSEARTEHERRVAAIENAPLGVEAPGETGGEDLDFILRELKNLDQQHWSSLLAEMVQGELQTFHPGPNRGVKQAPLAVLTNAIMPAVLVEIGYLSNAEEARLLARSAFQKDAGEALARAVARFFKRYPPGAGTGAGEAR